METINEFFKEFKDRLTSPFFGSLIISWLVINWRVPITLIFYKQDDLHLDGYNSYIDVITTNYCWLSYILYPLIWAFLYTFAYPHFRNWIKELLAKWSAKSDAKILKISKDGYVSVTKHMELQEKYEKNIEKITTFFNHQDEIQQQNIELQTELATAKLELTKLTSQKASTENRDPFTYINGNTFNFIFKRKGFIVGEALIQLFGDNVYVQNRNSGVNEVSQSLPDGQYTMEQYVGSTTTYKIAFTIFNPTLEAYAFIYIEKMETNIFQGFLNFDISFTATLHTTP